MVHVVRPRPFNVMWERNALPYGVVCADEFTCGAPRSAHPTVNIHYQIQLAGAVCSHQTNALRDTGMSRLRRAGRMCSSTLSVNCEYVEKWAHTVRPYGRVTRLPFSYFSKQSPVSGMRQVKKQKEVGVKRVETIGVYPLAPAVGTAPPPGR